jgi:hypothetical protein
MKGHATENVRRILLFEAKKQIPQNIEQIQKRETRRKAHLLQKWTFVPSSFLARGEHSSKTNEITAISVINSKLYIQENETVSFLAILTTPSRSSVLVEYSICELLKALACVQTFNLDPHHGTPPRRVSR